MGFSLILLEMSQGFDLFRNLSGYMTCMLKSEGNGYFSDLKGGN